MADVDLSDVRSAPSLTQMEFSNTSDSAFVDESNGSTDNNVLAANNLYLNGINDDTEQENDIFVDNDESQKKLIPRRSSLLKESAKNRPHARKKTVSFTSMPTEKKITAAQDCLVYMQEGSELIKVRSNSRQYHRVFTLNSDMTEIRWHPTSKKPHKARIHVSTIKEVHHGKTTDALKNKDIAGCYPDECAFSVIFGDMYESMDLIAATPDDANIWVTGLMFLLNINVKCRTPDANDDTDQIRDSWLLEMFRSADCDNEGILSEFEVVSLVKRLNNKLASAEILHKLKELEQTKSESGQRRRINSDEFITLFKDLSTRPEIYFILVRYAKNADCLTVDDLSIFLEAEQGNNRISKEYCLDIIRRFEPSSEGRSKSYLGIDGFTAYLLSEDCGIFDKDHETPCQDMTQPLSHYFIATSHNTYLMEDQLKGPSNIAGYIRALKKGCRCVELDCWDGPEHEPVIYHGRTLTSKISLRSVLEAINEHAFTSSPYPLIMSIENHCSVPQQKLMAAMFKDVFGDKIYSTHVVDEYAPLPSPDDLKYKIIIKGKKLSSSVDDEDGEVTEEDEGLETDRKRQKREGSIKKHRLIKEMSDFVNILRSSRFETFIHSKQKQKPCEICSFSESQALKMAMSCPEEFVNHNKSFLSRIYPTGMRVDSSNYNPQDLWNCGCQMVALNYQTPGLMMDLYDGWFRKNGQCGYVLKPKIMRDEISYFSANSKDGIPDVSPRFLRIKIISGQYFPKPRGSGAKGDITDPYIAVDIFGIPADCAEERTKTVHHGHNPIFDESFEFKISLPELALVRFAVLDDDYIGDEFIGQYTIPFECLLTGYRHIQLLNNTGEPIENCTLFVHIAVTDKCGGGRITRHGSSLKKRSKSHGHVRLKTIGVKSIDDTFKVATPHLVNSTSLRDSLYSAVASFKESCGLSQMASLKQCIRVLATRLGNNSEDIRLSWSLQTQIPRLEVCGNPPEILRKTLTAFDELMTSCQDVQLYCDNLYEKLVESHEAGVVWHEDLHSHCQQSGLKGKKLVKATESFAWNIRLLKGHSDLLQLAKTESLEYIRQVRESCETLGLSRETTMDETQNSEDTCLR